MGLADTGKLLLLLLIEHHRHRQTLFPIRLALPKLLYLLPYPLVLLLRILQLLLHPSGFAIHPLSANSSFLGVAAHVAVVAKNYEIRTGNPMLGGYHVHG